MSIVLVLQFHKGRNSDIINSAHIVKSCQENSMHDSTIICIYAAFRTCMSTCTVYTFIHSRVCGEL